MAIELSDSDRDVLRSIRGDMQQPEHDDQCETCVRRRLRIELLDRLIGTASMSDRDRLALSAQAGEEEHDKERVRQGLSPICRRTDGGAK